MKKLRFGKIACIIATFCVATAVASPAQTFTTLFRFNGTNGGGNSGATLTQGTDGNFYGTVSEGGGGNQFGPGTAFKISPAGKFKLLYQFCSQTNCLDGASPGPVVQGPNGNFYGVTNVGGTGNTGVFCTSCGTVFEMTPGGKLATLYNFCTQTNCSDGGYPTGSLVLGYDGKFYGTTLNGGATGEDCCGTVFGIPPSGVLSTFYTFCPNGSCDNGGPLGLTLGNNGSFYGSEGDDVGGKPLPGQIFELSPTAKFDTLYQFKGRADGFNPYFLIQGSDGNFDGFATLGTHSEGTLFQLTPSGRLTTLYSFCSQTNCIDGAGPISLIQGSDGNFYGTTGLGGIRPNQLCELEGGCGTIFKITPSGEFTTLYNFCQLANCADGAFPGALMQATDGTFYGSTADGGIKTSCYPPGFGCGTIFSLSMELGPFVKANPSIGKVDQVVDILGNNLTGTTSVTFNGTSATFKVISATYLKTEVPTGATTGMIEVTTPSSTLKSNVAFQVLP